MLDIFFLIKGKLNIILSVILIVLGGAVGLDTSSGHNSVLGDPCRGNLIISFTVGPTEALISRDAG